MSDGYPLSVGEKRLTTHFEVTDVLIHVPSPDQLPLSAVYGHDLAVGTDLATSQSDQPPAGPLDLAYRETLLAILIAGEEVEGVLDESVGKGRRTRERRNHSFEIPDARDRIVASTSNFLRPTLAVGRFMWMMSGSNRLDDVRFYEQSGLKGDRTRGVGHFSEDGLSIPGSNYGARLFSPRPGIDQVASCIRLIQKDPNTRRAALSVYQPEDAGRLSTADPTADSRDVPCTFGVLLSPRTSKLNVTIVMRSNNAWFLLPYNVFEFTLLSEIVATETSLEPGSYHHFAVSMHLYEQDWERARAAVGAPSFQLEPFPQMPSRSLDRVRRLCIWESWIRYQAAALTKRESAAEARKLRAYGEYWEPFGRVVLTKALLNADRIDLAHDMARGTAGPLGQLLRIELGIDSPTTLPSGIVEPSADVMDRLHQEELDRLSHRASQEHSRFWMMAARMQLQPD